MQFNSFWSLQNNHTIFFSIWPRVNLIFGISVSAYCRLWCSFQACSQELFFSLVTTAKHRFSVPNLKSALSFSPMTTSDCAEASLADCIYIHSFRCGTALASYEGSQPVSSSEKIDINKMELAQSQNVEVNLKSGGVKT